MFLSGVLVHDLSKEFDMKALREKKDAGQDKDTPPMKENKIVVTVDMAVLLLHQVMSALTAILLNRFYPFVIQTLNYSSNYLEMCLAIQGCVIPGVP